MLIIEVILKGDCLSVGAFIGRPLLRYILFLQISFDDMKAVYRL